MHYILTFGEGRFKVNIYLFVETLFCDVALTILQATKAVVFYKCQKKIIERLLLVHKHKNR